MMPSGTSNSQSSQDHEVDSPPTAIQLVMCHEAAITLNNFIVTKLLLRDRNIPAASTTYRDVIYLIKKCIMPPSGTTTPVTSRMISADEIHEIVHNAYQRAAVLPPSEPEDPMEIQDDGSFQNRSDDGDENHVRIQVISNCLPCSNVVTSRYSTTTTTTPTPPTPTARSVVSGNGNVTSSQLASSLGEPSRTDASILPNTSLHSTVSSSTVASQATTTSVNSTPAILEANSNKATTTTLDGTTATLATTAASTHMDDTVDDRLTTMSVYPMTIDDYHMNCAHPDLMNIHTNVAEDDPRIVQHQQFVEYHAAIILYNFGIIHQCLGMMENDTPMIDAEEDQNHGTRISNSNTVVQPSSMNDGTAVAASVPMTIDGAGNQDMQHHNDDDDDRCPKRLLASYKIMTNTLSWIHELVQPIMDEVLNESNEDAHHTNIETSTSLANTPGDHYYMNKYLQVMVLINYHVLDIIDTLNFPNGPYEYHCTMMNEILNFISYLEIFYPTTNHNNNDNSNFGNGSTRGSASPAA